MKTTQLRKAHIRIPPGFILRVPHGGEPQLRAIENRQTEESAQDDAAQQARRQTLLARAQRLGIVDKKSPIERWSNEHLEGAIFERTCTWFAARRAKIRGMNRRWSNHAFFVAMVKAKRLGNNQHRQ